MDSVSEKRFELHMDDDGDGAFVSINTMQMPPRAKWPKPGMQKQTVYDMGQLRYAYDTFFYTAFAPVSFSWTGVLRTLDWTHPPVESIEEPALNGCLVRWKVTQKYIDTLLSMMNAVTNFNHALQPSLLPLDTLWHDLLPHTFADTFVKRADAIKRARFWRYVVASRFAYSSFLICLSFGTTPPRVQGSHASFGSEDAWVIRAKKGGVPLAFINDLTSSWVANFETPRAGAFIDASVDQTWFTYVPHIVTHARCVPLWVRWDNITVPPPKSPLSTFFPPPFVVAKARSPLLPRREVTALLPASSYDDSGPAVNPEPSQAGLRKPWDLEGVRTDTTHLPVWTDSARPMWRPESSRSVITDKSFFQFHDEVQAWTYYMRERASTAKWEEHLRCARDLGSRQPKEGDKVAVWVWERDTERKEWTCENRSTKRADDVTDLWERTVAVDRFFHPILREWHIWSEMESYVERPKEPVMCSYSDDGDVYMDDCAEANEAAKVSM